MEDTQDWYKHLKKPKWAPKPYVFGRVWSVLYQIIVVVNIYVLILLARGEITWMIALPFWLNLFFNIIFTPIQFGLRNNCLALIDVSIVWLTIIWCMVAIAGTSWVVAVAYVPYLIWVTIATTLQASITIRN